MATSLMVLNANFAMLPVEHVMTHFQPLVLPATPTCISSIIMAVVYLALMMGISKLDSIASLAMPLAKLVTVLIQPTV